MVKKIKKVDKVKKKSASQRKREEIAQNNKDLQDIANLLRIDSLNMTTSAGSGHPTSCLSCAEIMSVIYFNEMKYFQEAHNIANDEFILSKGHAAPILYASLNRAGLLKESLSNFRKLKGNLQGHPIPSTEEPWIKVASGSLGQGLSVGLGVAMAQRIMRTHARTYVLLGDSEVAEGEIYEACEIASHYKVNNLCAILDMNRLGQRGVTMLGHDSSRYAKRFKSFGWSVYTCDGHSIQSLKRAFLNARKSKYPSLIIAKTFKGKGVSFLENKDGWHGKALNEEQLNAALKEIPSVEMPKIEIQRPKKFNLNIKKPTSMTPSLNLNEEIATREAYGYALEKLLTKDEKVLVLDAEVSNSTFSAEVKKVHDAEHFIESYIAEQNMIGMAQGLAMKGFHVFSSSFASFLSRAHDQLRMSSLSGTNMTICGSHAGVSIGEDGASQMGLDDIAMFRDFPNSIVLYPSDAISTIACVDLCNQFKNRGLKYIRTTRSKIPVIYEKDEKFALGDFKILKQSKSDKVVLIGSGITLHESLKAYEKLKEHKLHAAVVDLYCIKPLNIKKLKKFIEEHGKKVIITEDHYGAGGIGEMIAHELLGTDIRIKTLHVTKMPHSGSPAELLNLHGINARHIALHARTFL
jgi:transketolase